MKNSIKAKKHPNPPQGKSSTGGPTRFSSRGVLIAGCLLLVSAGGTWAVMEYVVWNILPAELVGAWEVTQGPPEYDEAVFQFHRSGKMVGHLNRNGDLHIMNADVRVEDEKLYITTRRKSGGDERTSVQQIRKLTPHQLVLEDEQGKSMKLKRVN